MKVFAKDMKFFEEIDRNIKTKDSIVYNYTWHFTQDVKANRERNKTKRQV
jgi:hypothetical protein